MVSIENYNQDGACWQSRAVLAYIQSQIFRLEDFFGKDIFYLTRVGRYENCREQGYVVSVSTTTEQINIAFYEHRNCDDICTLVADGTTINTPNVDFMWKDRGENPSKYDYNASFRYGEIVKCGKWIIDEIMEWAEKIKANREVKEK